MDQTPTRATRSRNALVNVLDEEIQGHAENNENDKHITGERIRKPPPITPRRFKKFFTPRPKGNAQAVTTSRHALRTISSSALNTRRRPALQTVPEDYLSANENQNSRKKRKYSEVSSSQSTPQLRSVTFLPSSQDVLPSSPIKYGDDSPEPAVVDDDDEYATTEIEDAYSDEEDQIPTGPRIVPYASAGTSRARFSSKLTGRRTLHIAETSNLWQHDLANFYSAETDVNNMFLNRAPRVLPFSMAACNTNPIVAVADEEGYVHLLDSANVNKGDNGFRNAVLSMQPHDNAVMDIAFSSGDDLMATASGDQTCQVVDVRAQRSLYSLMAHTASVKKIQFQPGSNDKVLASCGRDGTICVWDLRLKSSPSIYAGRRGPLHTTEMAQDISYLAPVIEIMDAHGPDQKSKAASNLKQNKLPSRKDFSITSLTFLDASRSNIIATASEVDTIIKLWDLRKSKISPRKREHTQVAVTATEEPRSHEIHRKFGINSIALNTDGSRMFALSRDHTVYAYSTSHLVLGCSPEMLPSTSSSRSLLAPMRKEPEAGVGPLYGLRHPSLRVATFWPRLAVRKATDSTSELLAVGSTEDCTVLFPTSERYHTPSTRTVAPLHNFNFEPVKADESERRHIASLPFPYSRPTMTRSYTSSFTSLFTPSRQEEDSLPIYYHGTPLIRGHEKEVTSVAWSSEGNLVTSSDDYTIRCWREDAVKAREMRTTKNDAVALAGQGWSHIGLEGWDEEG